MKCSSLSLVIMYMVFGTLYNRYVLRLRGVDQIPQFSIASMKYHAHEALDWMKDIAVGMHEGGRSMGTNSGFFPRSGLNPESELGLGGSRGFSRSEANPVSHQTQNQANNREGSTGTGSSGGFVRPQIQTGNRNSKRGEMNPISHQAQSRIEHGESLSPPPPPMPLVKENPRPKPLELETSGSTKEEREFMLGDDEGEEGEDVGVALPSRVPAPVSQRLDPANADVSGVRDAEGNNAVTMRGRDLGGGNVTRL
jgi:cation-dependent mannose-6-phosphate receptor